MNKAPIANYADALGLFKQVAARHGHSVRQLESRRHQLVTPGGAVVCTLSLRRGIPVIARGQRSTFLHTTPATPLADAAALVTRAALALV